MFLLRNTSTQLLQYIHRLISVNVISRFFVVEGENENSSATKLSKHIPSGFSMSTISWFRIIENKHDVYRGKDCMKKFCESLREHAMKINNLKKIKWSY